MNEVSWRGGGKKLRSIRVMFMELMVLASRKSQSFRIVVLIILLPPSRPHDQLSLLRRVLRAHDFCLCVGFFWGGRVAVTGSAVMPGGRGRCFVGHHWQRSSGGEMCGDFSKTRCVSSCPPPYVAATTTVLQQSCRLSLSHQIVFVFFLFQMKTRDNFTLSRDLAVPRELTPLESNEVHLDLPLENAVLHRNPLYLGPHLLFPRPFFAALQEREWLW